MGEANKKSGLPIKANYRKLKEKESIGIYNLNREKS